MAYGLDKGKEDELIPVRLGGGTFDVPCSRSARTTSRAQDGVDLSKDAIAMQRLKDAAEQAKKELSSATSTNINLQYLHERVRPHSPR